MNNNNIPKESNGNDSRPCWKQSKTQRSIHCFILQCIIAWRTIKIFRGEGVVDGEGVALKGA